MIYLLIVATKLSALFVILFFVCGFIATFGRSGKSSLTMLCGLLVSLSFTVLRVCLSMLGIYFVFTCNSVHGLL